MGLRLPWSKPEPADDRESVYLGAPPAEEPPDFDESPEAKRRRRYGSVTRDQWRWA